MRFEKIAAFSDGKEGGSPTAVFFVDKKMPTHEMQKLAAEIGYNETAFASPLPDGAWCARYFSPQTELPLSGHANPAIGAALAMRNGTSEHQIKTGRFQLNVRSEIKEDSIYCTSLDSPETSSQELNASVTSELLDIFGYNRSQLNPDIAPAMINAGANHFVLALKDRADLADMYYELEEGQEFMRKHDVLSVMLVYAENNQLFHARNTYAAWGILEDSATGPAATAFSGYLRDIDWPHGNAIEIIQGEDMGSRSILKTQFSDEKGSPVKLKGKMGALH